MGARDPDVMMRRVGTKPATLEPQESHGRERRDRCPAIVRLDGEIALGERDRRPRRRRSCDAIADSRARSHAAADTEQYELQGAAGEPGEDDVARAEHHRAGKVTLACAHYYRFGGSLSGCVGCRDLPGSHARNFARRTADDQLTRGGNGILGPRNGEHVSGAHALVPRRYQHLLTLA